MATHRSSYTREYKAWGRMKACCFNKNVPVYKKYGGKGISICREWKDNFTQFLADMGPMPEDCTGLALIDETKEFCKWNCQWVKKSIGRPVSKVPKERRRKRTGVMKNPKTVCLVIEKDHLDFIKAQAMHRSVEVGHVIEANELIREALAKAFPCPKQFDMFGARR